MIKPTYAQKRVLAFVEAFIAEHQYPPSIRQICEGLGNSSTSTVHYHLQALRRKGYLEIEPGSPRALRVVQRG